MIMIKRGASYSYSSADVYNNIPNPNITNPTQPINYTTELKSVYSV